MNTPDAAALSSLSTWDALCKDCRNIALRAEIEGKPRKRAKNDPRQEKYEYSDVHANRQYERGQSRSDRCPECRKRHKKEISAFPVAYIDIAAIGEASKYVTDPAVGPTGPLGGLGPLPDAHNRRTESVDLGKFALGLTDDHILELLGIMVTHQVVVLEAGTGTGKSTLAPFRLMNPPDGAPYRPTDVGPIVVTEPRVPATTEVAQFVGESMCFGHDAETCFEHVGPGYPVGYQCEGKKVWDEACSLVYVTDGTMVNWITNGDLARIGTVVVDEAHERSENIDLILTLLAAKLPRYPHLRVVIASATIDKTYFIKFFEKTPSIRVGHYFVEAKKQIGYGVPLFADVNFSEEVVSDGYSAVDAAGEVRFTLPGWPDEPNLEERGESLRNLTRDRFLELRHPASDWRTMNKQNIVDAAIAQTMKILHATDSGDVLVFMPNRDMVSRVQMGVASRIEDEADVLGIIRVHWLMRETPKNEKKAALAPCSAGERKVVVASNLAETSLTIAGIKYVVDSGLVIQAEWDPDLAVTHAPLKVHSQSGVRQRWGRVGRKTHGWVFPLYSLQDYLAMPRDTPAGSTQTNLEGTILKLIAAGEDPGAVAFPADFEAEGVQRDSFAQISAESFRRERARALAAAQVNGAVSRDGKSLTSLGAELIRSRVSSEKAIALMFADRLACVPEVAMALVALSGKEDTERNRGHLAGPGRILAADREWPIEWNVHARKCHEALALGCEDDLDLVIRIFALWRAAPEPTAWCAQWWINEEVLRELESAAGNLMDSLAPGMSKEARRPLDPRLAGRARAVLSRGLGSLRYGRTGDGTYKSANANQPDPVRVSERRLIPAADQVIGLVRERPSERAGLVVHEGELLGLVSWLSWAAEGEPTDFELLRRVSVRRDTIQDFDDPTASLRAAYPVGARIHVSTDEAGAVQLRKLTVGLMKPDRTPMNFEVFDEDAGSTLAYSSETGARDDSSPMRAGVEVPDEEARLIPIPIAELETSELEDFTGYEPAGRAADTADNRVDFGGPRLSVAHTHLDTSTDWSGTVRGYLVDGVTTRLLLDPVPADVQRPYRAGDQIRAICVGPLATHMETVTELWECDEQGAPLPGKPIYIDGVTIDSERGPDPMALQPGSIWNLMATLNGPALGPLRLSLADAVLDRISSDPAATARVKRPAITSFTAVLTGKLYRDWRQQMYAIATTEAFSPDLAPEFSIWIGKLERAGVAPTAGTRLRVELAVTNRPRSGKWKPADVELLIDRHPDLFEKGPKPDVITLKNAGPLSGDALGALLDIDPSSPTYVTNSWQLWESSRTLSVTRVSAIGEAEITPDATRAFKRSMNIIELQRQYGVGIVMEDNGKISVSGNAGSVSAALDRIRGTALQPRIAIQAPARPDAKFPRYPSREAIKEILEEGVRDSRWVSGGYDQRKGLLLPQGSVASEDEARKVASLLRDRTCYYTVRLSFQEPRGYYAFQKKDRWTAIAATVDGIDRWVIEAGVSWGLFSTDGNALASALGAIRLKLPAVVFTTSPIEELGPTIEILPALAQEFAITYVSPVPPETTAVASEPAQAVSDDPADVRERTYDRAELATSVEEGGISRESAASGTPVPVGREVSESAIGPARGFFKSLKRLFTSEGGKNPEV